MMGARKPEWAVWSEGLVKHYGGLAVVAGVDLAVQPGECFGLLGPNGAGKTTTLRMLLGHTPPSAGTLQVLGLPVPARAREVRARAGVVPQVDSLDPDFTVVENLYTYASYFGLRGPELDRRVSELLRFASLEGREDAAIQALSGGMKRRLTLARALINDPELVVLDEPTTGLDPQARQHIWRRLRALLDRGRTLILTTHYMEEAERLCDRVAIIDQGRVVASDAPGVLIRAHIENQVVELDGRDAERWRSWGLQPDGVRQEDSGETVRLYAADERLLLASLAPYPELRWVHRRANLEDVFLRLTGHGLRD
ncbi:ATP-binding cassette domain-containing protein [Alkalilimnicola ehrlichii MLHE-1]|uniref:ABC transporter related protein n=1 Tax=Alkalilimnicola ehrlichii (strain ATCC BAA-1101 / DSM 17681 / MLHE-1) TaxID=187272 RepID=Q0A9P3_ALKEH|nr:ATP-binding cassette domain-containing protein [Alkalilimnicola ehrlichii]ABI56444.1 ABC transporter related protein [Alkalilimnicola ehrlichii MLHE-1]